MLTRVVLEHTGLLLTDHHFLMVFIEQIQELLFQMKTYSHQLLLSKLDLKEIDHMLNLYLPIYIKLMKWEELFRLYLVMMVKWWMAK